MRRGSTEELNRGAASTARRFHSRTRNRSCLKASLPGSPTHCNCVPSVAAPAQAIGAIRYPTWRCKSGPSRTGSRRTAAAIRQLEVSRSARWFIPAGGFVGIHPNEKRPGSMKGIEKSSRVMGLRRFSMGQLLIALALLFFFVPFVEEIKGGDLIVSGLLSLVLLAGVL